jgi:uncharacterized membrane protein YccC
MTKDNSQAPETGGQTSAVVPEEDPSAARSDEELRRLAAERLAEHLEMGVSLVARCEHFAELPRGDRLGPLYAAARLMRANAFVAQALANVVQVERRKRSIIERIQPPDPKIAELNANLQREIESSEYRLKVYRRMNELVEQSIRARTGDAPERDEIAQLVQQELENLAQVKKARAEFGAS